MSHKSAEKGIYQLCFSRKINLTFEFHQMIISYTMELLLSLTCFNQKYIMFCEEHNVLDNMV